jgi:DNA-binding LacI/PurR family transcriptional regulator
VHDLVQADVTFVSADRIDYTEKPVNFVTVENIQSTHNAISHLIGLGRRRIGTVTGDLNIVDVLDRIEGYKAALMDAGIGVDPDLIHVGGFSYEQGYLGAKKLLELGVDAIFAHNNTIAGGAISAILDNGLTVPGDVSVVGFDDLPAAMRNEIGVTAIDQPIQEKGYRLGQVLIDLILGNIEAPQQIYIPAPLVIRDT